GQGLLRRNEPGAVDRRPPELRLDRDAGVDALLVALEGFYPELDAGPGHAAERELLVPRTPGLVVLHDPGGDLALDRAHQALDDERADAEGEQPADALQRD